MLIFSQFMQKSSKCTCPVTSLTTLLKRRLWFRCFPVNFAKFFRTPLVAASRGMLYLPWSTKFTENKTNFS